MHPNNHKAEELLGQCHGFKVCMGAPFLGGYIEYEKSKDNWLKKKTEKWERDICEITKTAEKYPQERYALEVRVIQSE